MTRTITTLSLLSLVLVILALPAHGQAQIIEVQAMPENVFEPQEIHVMAGTTVRWINEGGVHTVTANETGDDGQPLFDENLATAGETFEYTFENAGTFAYHCKPHASIGMVGTVFVSPSDGDSDDAKPGPGGNDDDATGDGAGDGDGNGDNQDSPAVGAMMLVAALGVLALAVRRRT